MSSERAAEGGLVHAGLESLARLERSRGVRPHPELWVDKCLYTPRSVVEAVIAAARRAVRQGRRRGERRATLAQA
jgi:hypothetical protein